MARLCWFYTGCFEQGSLETTAHALLSSHNSESAHTYNDPSNLYTPQASCHSAIHWGIWADAGRKALIYRDSVAETL